MSEKRKYRTFTPEQKTEIVLAGLRGDRTVRDICREYEIAETLYYQWRDRLLEGGKAALATSRDRGASAEAAENKELRRKVAQLERALGKKTYELEVAGELSRDWT
jgi:transposase